MSTTIPPPTEIDLAAWFAFGRRHRLTLALAALVGLALGSAHAVLGTRWYLAEVRFVSVSDDGSGMMEGGSPIGGLAALAGVNLGMLGGSNREEALAVLRSRAVLDGFVTRKQLLPTLFSGEWDAEAKRWKHDDPADHPTLSDAYKLFERRIWGIDDDKRTGIITLSIMFKDREVAAAWANELVAEVNTKLRARAVEEAQRGLKYLNDELEKTGSMELRQMIFGLVENQMNRIMIANVRDEYAFKIIDPAIAPDPDDYVRPRGPIEGIGGLLFGLFIGVAIGLARDRGLLR